MENNTKTRAFWWLLFLVFSVAMAYAIYTHWPWLTLILPFLATSLVKALDAI